MLVRWYETDAGADALEKLREVQLALFEAATTEESLALIAECEALGNPIGLFVLMAQQWSAALRDDVERVRALYGENELPIFVICGHWEREHLLDAARVAVNLTFETPVDWDLFALQALRKMRSSTRAWRMRADKARAEELLSQHRKASMAQDLWTLDLATRQLDFTDPQGELIGYSIAEIGRDLDAWLERIHPLDALRLSQALAENDWAGDDSAEAPEELSFEFRLRHRNGSWAWILMQGRLRRDEDGLPVALVGAHTDITRSKTTDAITGLANRFQFEDWLTVAARERADQGLAVFLVGVDRFSLLQDSLGPSGVDRLLRQVAERLQGLGAEFLARTSPDEFALVWPAGTDCAARRIVDCFRRPFWIDGKETFVSASIGHRTAPSAENTAMDCRDADCRDADCRDADWRDAVWRDAVWRDAEIALHAAKAAGGNRVVAYEPGMRRGVMERMEMERDLKRAVDQWEFEIFYQPKVSLQSNRIVGFEALIRWRHPEKGIVPPGQFIPLAEETGLIIPIGLRTVREACHTIRQWQQEFGGPSPLEVSVNLSVRQFQDPNLIAATREILREKAIPPATLQFEVTESVLVDNPEKAFELVRELRDMGIGVKIDDFGTGYSSLSYLHRLPFDTLKIDRSFISTMGQDHSAFEIVRVIITLAENLGLQVVAEGVETRHQAEQLRQLGCTYGQGYLFAPPLTREAAHRLLLEQCASLGSLEVAHVA